MRILLITDLPCGDGERSEFRRGFTGREEDVSRLFALGTRREAFIHASAWYFLRAIDAFERVVTDRLQVAIGGALLGKPVQFYPGAYYKNRAVFEHSIKDKFPGVEWREWGRVC